MIYQIMLAEVRSEDEYVQIPLDATTFLPFVIAPYYKETIFHKFETLDEAFNHLHKLQATKNLVEGREYYVYSRPL
jgi:hypothetical protein